MIKLGARAVIRPYPNYEVISMLTFFGRGSAFADAHNSAYLAIDRTLVLFDCPASAFPAFKRLDLASFREICVLVTHTHGDHVRGLGNVVDYVWFVLSKIRSQETRLTVIAPSKAVAADLRCLLEDIEGCEHGWYTLTTADAFPAPWLCRAVPTLHADQLPGKCFGYLLEVGGRHVVYTGDTRTLTSFLPLLAPGDILYTECAMIDSGVHVHLPAVLPTLQALTAQGVTVYLMHLDDEDAIRAAIEGTALRLAPLIGEA